MLCELMLLTIVLCLSAAALAADGTITVTLTGPSGGLTPGATCTFNVQSWSWGASNPTRPGSIAGRPSLSDLSILKQLDACTPVLFQAVVEGSHWTTLNLVQADKNGEVVAQVTASSVYVDSVQDGGTVGSNPTESVSFAFISIKIQEGSGPSFCWNTVTQPR